MFRSAFSICAFCFFASVVHPAFAANKFSYESEPGDFIGQGGSGTFSASEGAVFTLEEIGPHLRFSVERGNEKWSIDLAPPPGEQLRPRIYYDAERPAGLNGRAAGFEVAGEGRGCNDVWAKFAVDQLHRDASGKIDMLELTFEQQCEGPTAPFLRGALKYNAPPLSFALETEPGDPTTDGIDRMNKTYTGSTSLFELSGDTSRVWFLVHGQHDRLNVEVTAPIGRTLQVGSYAIKDAVDAQGVKFSFFAGTACYDQRGTFTIHGIKKFNNKVTGLHASFERYCVYSRTTTKGVIHFKK